jgi:hypothetical protein
VEDNIDLSITLKFFLKKSLQKRLPVQKIAVPLQRKNGKMVP